MMTLLGRTARSLLRQLTAGIFVLLILDVFIRVKSQCLTACIGQSIKTVNVTTGECISCFPCPECQAGYSTSSVPCGTTVPFGTAIRCVVIPPDPVVVSKASAQTRHLTSTPLAITSSSKQLIVTPVTSNVHPVVVPATSSSAPAASSIKQSEGSETIHKPKGDKEEYSKWKNNTPITIYIFSAICLLITSGAIVWRLSKKKRFQAHIVRQPENLDGPSTSPVQPCRSDIHCTCNIDLATNSVAFSRIYTHHSDHDTSGTRHDNPKFQPDPELASPDGNTIPSTLVAPPADQDESAIVPVSVSDNLDATGVLQNKIPSANTYNVFLAINPGNIQQTSQTSSDSSQLIQRGTAAVAPFAEFTSCGNNSVIPASYSGMHMANQGAKEENRGYSTHIMCVPLPVIQNIRMLLDIERVTDENDYRMFGSELGLTPFQIRSLKQQCIMSNTCNSPSYVLLMQVFSALPNSGTLAHLIPILTKMERHDVIKVIDEWVDSQSRQ